MEARKLYFTFYADNRQLGAYFRTLFRIFDLIENWDDKSNSNFRMSDYIKIVRAQLTESELFFIRYNCISLYGRKFVPIVCKYHLLKHLNILDMLEFKKWATLIPTPLERAYIDIMLVQMKRTIRDLLEENKNNDLWIKPEEQRLRYNFHFVKHSNTEIRVSLIKKSSIREKRDEYKPLDYFSDGDLLLFLKTYLQELFVYSHLDKNYIEKVVFSDRIRNINRIRNIIGSTELMVTVSSQDENLALRALI